jgi:hypothetical protein
VPGFRSILFLTKALPAARVFPSLRVQTMNAPASSREYLVISRGQWDADASPEQIQQAIDQFYVWLDRMVGEKKMRTGQRLRIEGKTVSKNGVITDGPFGESKEVIGGYWFIFADSLDEAAKFGAGNPCLQYGLSFEIRPIDPEQASAFKEASETPGERRGER